MSTEAGDRKFVVMVLMLSLLATVILAILFLQMPEIDLIVQKYFYDDSTVAMTGFILKQYPVASVLRRIIMIAYGIWYIIIILGLIAAIAQKPWPLSRYLNFDFKQWLFLTITSLIGPLLIANLILKNNWGRARPRQILEFGGDLQFSPPILVSDQCVTNCSFISGEASSMFMIFIALAFVVPAKRGLLIFLTFLFGSLSGLMRIGLGGHFLSDVIFAGLFMFISAAIIFWIIFRTSWATENIRA